VVAVLGDFLCKVIFSPADNYFFYNSVKNVVLILKICRAWVSLATPGGFEPPISTVTGQSLGMETSEKWSTANMMCSRTSDHVP